MLLTGLVFKIFLKLLCVWNDVYEVAEDSFVEWVLSFRLYLGSRDRTWHTSVAQ